MAKVDYQEIPTLKKIQIDYLKKTTPYKLDGMEFYHRCIQLFQSPPTAKDFEIYVEGFGEAK